MVRAHRSDGGKHDQGERRDQESTSPPDGYDRCRLAGPSEPQCNLVPLWGDLRSLLEQLQRTLRSGRLFGDRGAEQFADGADPRGDRIVEVDHSIANGRITVRDPMRHPEHGVGRDELAS